MNDATQTLTPVGMDAHSETLALCLTRWRHGADPVVLREITTTLDALEQTYARQVPPGALTVLEASRTPSPSTGGSPSSAREP